jgi:ribosome-associated protein
MRDIIVTPRLTIPAGELGIAFARSGGPGGQNDDRSWLLSRLANRLTNDGELIVTSTLTRDQIKNRDDAMSKMALIVRAALDRPKNRRATRPTRASKRRRVEGKRHRAEIKRNRRSDD